MASNAADKLNKVPSSPSAGRSTWRMSWTSRRANKAARWYARVRSHPKAKLDALAELVDELQGEPLLVGYEYQHEGVRIAKAIPGAVNVADLSAAKFKGVEAAWNRGEIPLLAGHPQSIGHGLNLQGTCQHVCWYTFTWNGSSTTNSTAG